MYEFMHIYAFGTTFIWCRSLYWPSSARLVLNVEKPSIQVRVWFPFLRATEQLPGIIIV